MTDKALDPKEPQSVSNSSENTDNSRNIGTAVLLMLHGTELSRELTEEEKALQKALEVKVDVDYSAWSFDAW